MRTILGRTIWLILLCFAVSNYAIPLLAQDTYKVGESVEVFFLGEWRPGVVTDKNKKGAFQVRFNFANTEKFEVVMPDKLRHEYESGAMWRGRMWSDDTGKFKVRAALLKFTSDSVSLRTEEGKELTIPIAKLSDSDQKFLTKMRTEAGGGGLLAFEPEAEVFSTDSVELGRIRSTPHKRREHQSGTSGFSLDPDPLRTSLQLKQGGVPIPQNKSTEYVSGLIPLGGTDQWLLGGVSDRFDENAPSRLFWGQLSTGKLKSTQALPNGHRILDYHPRSKQLLSFSTKQFGNRENSVLTVWKTDPTTTEAKGIVSWKAKFSFTESVKNAAPWARFVSDELVIQRDEDHRIVGWDIKNKTAKWTTPQESFFTPQPVLSPNGKYLFVPEDTQLRILDPSTGSELGIVFTPDSCSSVALHSDGRKLAVLARNRLMIVDLTGKDPVREIDASPIAMVGDSRSEWVTDNLIAVHRFDMQFVLFDIQSGAPLWTYFSPFGMQTGGGNTRTIIAGHLVYSAEPPPPQSGMVIGAVKFPEDKILKMAETLDRKALALTGPGSRFRIDVNSIEGTDNIRRSIQKQLSDNSWIEDDAGDFTIAAKLYRAQQQTVEYQSFGSITRGGPSTTSVTIQPFISSIEILRGKDVVWSQASSTGAPPILRLKESESVQDAVSQWERPDPNYFAFCDVPQEILDPEKKNGLGATDITVRGLVPRSPQPIKPTGQ